MIAFQSAVPRNALAHATTETPGSLVWRMNPRYMSGRCFSVINSLTTWSQSSSLALAAYAEQTRRNSLIPK